MRSCVGLEINLINMDIDLIHSELEKKDWIIGELGQFDLALIADVAEVVEKQLRIGGVSQQRELLIDCVDHCYNVDNYNFRTTEDKVDNCLESINCG